jgi:chromosome segregation ATPase
MARPSVIAIQDIEDAVDTLNGLGKPINPYQVRTLLGKGSEAKIAYFLKGLDIDIDYQDEDPVTKRLVSLIRPVVLELNDQYDELVTKEKKTLEERLEKAKQQSEALKKENHEAQKNHQQVTFRITELEKSLVETKQTLTDKSAKLSKAEQSNENLKQALVAAENALIELRHHKEQLQTEHATLVNTLKSEHAETLKGYKKALEQSNTSIQQTRDQLTDAGNKNKVLAETNEELKDKLNLSHQENALISHQITESNKQLADQKNQNKHQAEDLEKQQKIIDTGDQELAAAKQTIITLKEHQGINSTLQTDNQKLTMENEKLRTEVDVLRSVVDKLSEKKNES